MKVKNEMRLEFLSRSQNESFARAAVAAFAAQLDPTLEEITDIKTAVSEAVTNAIIHGYENPNEMVQIITRIYDTYVEIEVIDHGKGIEDIELARQPLYTSKPELERSGMGFTVMETFMDQVEVISAPGQGTKVRMIKYIGNEERETERE
ncbi:MAG: anti-sigma F factor [Clostridiales bacterium]|jgi:stage II sporulation protein AB (anti-sigma F factor)|nr:anti-sigma F factor [Clostridiales bacterium]